MSKSRDLSSYGTAALADTGVATGDLPLAEDVVLVDAGGNIDIAGTVTADGLTVDGDATVSGNVGIGGASLLAKLNSNADNQGDSYFSGSTQNTRPLIFSTFATVSPSAGHKINATSGNGALAFATGSAERMRIDSAGIVTMPYQPSFLAHATVDQALTNDNVVADFGGTTHNIGGHFSTSTGRFTAPVAGSYYFSAGALIEGYTIAAYRITIRFRINGAETKNTIAGGGAHNTTHDDGEASVSGVMYLNANEYVDVKVSPTGVSGTGNIWGATTSSAWTNFNGHLIG